MQQYKNILMYGFAIFAMFFGSGNLVFPIQIGAITSNNWMFGFLGLFITGVLLPCLGLLVIKLYKGNYYSFFGEAGSIAGTLLPLFTLSLLGSFGVVPRCITVAHGGISYLYPETSLTAFSAMFCFITFLLCLKDQIMLKIMGKLMSPILVIALFILIFSALTQAPYFETTSISTKFESFEKGFLTGYQTMDLFAAFFFSSLVFSQMKNALPETASDSEVIMFAIKPSIIAGFLLGIVYLGFVLTGAYYSAFISDMDPEFMLSSIAKQAMGDNAALFVAIAIVMSCLTTAVALNNIYATYICNALGLQSYRMKIILFGTTAMSFVVSLLDFQGIASFLAPMLEMSYPALIALTVVCIITKGAKSLKVYGFYAITILTLIIYHLPL